MKNFRKKAAPALVLLAGASMSLAGVTYAWFNTNNKVSASNIKVNVVDAAGGIAICSTQNGNYGTGADLSNGEFNKLMPVSSSGLMNTVAEGDTAAARSLSFFTANIGSESAKLEAAAAFSNESYVADTSKGFIQFDLWFENTNIADKDIYFNYETGTSMFDADKLVQRSMRLAFVAQSYATSKIADEQYTTADQSVVVVEPYKDNHLVATGLSTGDQKTYGINKAFSKNDVMTAAVLYTQEEIDADTKWSQEEIDRGVEGSTGKTAGDTKDEEYRGPAFGKTAGSVKTPAVLRGEIDIQPSDADYTANKAKKYDCYTLQDTVTIAEASSAETGGTDGHTDKLFSVKADGYTRVTVYIWIEGQDVDNLNIVSGASFNTLLSFAAEAQPTA